MSPSSNTANDRDLSTWAWVDKNADDLRGDIVTHLKVYGLDPQEVEDCLRVIFISIRQWSDARDDEVRRLREALEVAHKSLKWEERRCGSLHGVLAEGLQATSLARVANKESGE